MFWSVGVMDVLGTPGSWCLRRSLPTGCTMICSGTASCICPCLSPSSLSESATLTGSPPCSGRCAVHESSETHFQNCWDLGHSWMSTIWTIYQERAKDSPDTTEKTSHFRKGWSNSGCHRESHSLSFGALFKRDLPHSLTLFTDFPESGLVDAVADVWYQ